MRCENFPSLVLTSPSPQACLLWPSPSPSLLSSDPSPSPSPTLSNPVGDLQLLVLNYEDYGCHGNRCHVNGY